MKGCKTAPPKPARRGRETEKQPFYLSFVFSLPSTPPHPPPVSPSFLFSFHHREDFFLLLFLCLSVQLSHSNGTPGGFLALLFFSSLFSSFFLLSYFSKRVLFAVGVSFENQVTPFFLLFFLSLFFSSEKGNKDELKRRRGRAAGPLMEMGGPGRHKGGRGTSRPPAPREAPGVLGKGRQWGRGRGRRVPPSRPSPA